MQNPSSVPQTLSSTALSDDDEQPVAINTVTASNAKKRFFIDLLSKI
jgi:hypothetical protein